MVSSARQYEANSSHASAVPQYLQCPQLRILRARELLADMTLEQTVGQLFFARCPAADGAAAFERSALEAVGLLDSQIPPRYSTSYFNHVFGGGYAAGYYSYLWTEVLADNVAETFARRGALRPEVGQALRDKILSRGNTVDLMKSFSDFTGLASPDASALLKARGL